MVKITVVSKVLGQENVPGFTEELERGKNSVVTVVKKYNFRD